MTLIERLGLTILHKIDPETAHNLSLKALNSGCIPLPGAYSSSRIETDIAGLKIVNPIGLAAGYDKNAIAIKPLERAGFGFIEVGAATPRPQKGNPKPRLFRLSEDQGVINRFGFNNDGLKVVAARLAKRTPGPIPVGLNLGANKKSIDRPADFAQVLAGAGNYIDFATINVSSPNTQKLRDLQQATTLFALLQRVVEVRDRLEKPIPIFLKIAPDLDDESLAELAEVVIKSKIDAIIATNTTVSRNFLKSRHRNETGGLSGKPLFEESTRILAKLSKLTDGKLPLIGVGGISSPEDAFAKIQAGACAIQLYSAMVYNGLSIVDHIAHGLDALLEKNGFATLKQAVGSKRENWL